MLFSRLSCASALVFSASCVLAASKAEYYNNAVTTLNTLNGKWFNSTTGLWDNQWWESGNSLTALGDLVMLNPSNLAAAEDYYNITFAQAPNQQGAKDFTNDYYDDMGWWAMGWIRAYDVTQDQRYLSTAASIFKDMSGGYNATCGGHWWNKPGSGPSNGQQFNNAIGNELFLQVAAALANRDASNKASYLNWAQTEWAWFKQSGMINSDYLVNEGLNLTTCKNNNGTVFTYAQGVIIGGLVELNTAAPDQSLIDMANKLAQAGIAKLTQGGILYEQGTNTGLDEGGAVFKGVFVRNLKQLQAVSPNQAYVDFLQKNADSLWSTSHNAQDNTVGSSWAGSANGANNTFNMGAQTAGLDLLNAAAAVST